MALLPLLQATALVGAALGVTARGPGTETLRAAPAIGCLQGAEAGQERGQASGRIERLVGAMGTGLSIEVEAGTRGVALRASEAAIREV